jgi:two-component system NtrC family response regulator
MSSPAPGTRPTRLFIVDDDPSIVSQLELAFSGEYEVRTSDNPVDAWTRIQAEHPDLVTLDLSLEADNPETGFSLLEKCHIFDPTMKVVMITGNDTEENAMRAVHEGAFDFFGKPVDLEALSVLLRRGATLRHLEQQNARNRSEPGEERLGDLLGRSEEMQSVFRLIRKVAPTDFTVSILGESGTGKEMVAREIHRLSKRADQPFVSISCGAIPEALLESELFGHEKGAFTSAHTSRPGRLETADRGTVFLDEIGEMPMLLQVKLLRFLQEREVERVGGRKVIPLDVRIIAATNRNLSEEVKAGRFREDLFYRLSVVNILLPPLRKRSEDIDYLAEHFLAQYAAELNRSGLAFSRTAKLALRSHPWPGHVRELEHRVQRAALMAAGRLVQPEDLELSGPDREGTISLREARDRAVERTVVDALRRTRGNISRAAQELEVSRPTLHDLLRKMNIDARSFKDTSDSPAEVGRS